MKLASHVLVSALELDSTLLTVLPYQRASCTGPANAATKFTGHFSGGRYEHVVNTPITHKHMDMHTHAILQVHIAAALTVMSLEPFKAEWDQQFRAVFIK